MKINRKYDRAYAWFILLTKKFPNLHFPKIENAKILRYNGEKYYVFLIEKLIPVTLSDLKIENKIIARNCFDSLNKIVKNPNKSIEDLNLNLDGRPTLKNLLEGNKSLIEALRTIGKNSHGYMIDIHMQNIMKRKDGTLVIIDPLADKNKL